VSRVDNLAPQGYTLGDSAVGRNVDNNLQRVVSTLEGRSETRPVAKVNLYGSQTRTSEKNPNQATQVNTSYVQRRPNMTHIAMSKAIRENATEENSLHSKSFSFDSVTGSRQEIRQGTQ
jgi:hypothetical protein